MKKLKTKSKSLIALFFSIAFVLLSFVIAVITVIENHENKIIQENLVTVEAIVSEVSHRPVSFNNKTGKVNKVDYMYYVSYKFENFVYQDVFWKYDSKKIHSIDDIVEITIDPENPGRVYSYSMDVQIFWSISFLLVGIVFIGIFRLLKKDNYDI